MFGRNEMYQLSPLGLVPAPAYFYTTIYSQLRAEWHTALAVPLSMGHITGLLQFGRSAASVGSGRDRHADLLPLLLIELADWEGFNFLGEMSTNQLAWIDSSTKGCHLAAPVRNAENRQVFHQDIFKLYSI